MRVTVRVRPLDEALRALHNAIGGPMVPLYENVRVTASEKGLVVDATDLEIWLERVVEEAQVDEPGIALIPYRRLQGVVARLPRDESVTLSITQTESAEESVLQWSTGEARLFTENPGDFPVRMAMPGDGVVEVEPDSLLYMLRHTAFAAAPERGRFMINGVHLKINADGGCRACATDTARLAMVQCSLVNPGRMTAEWFVPLRAVRDLEALAEASSGRVRLGAIGQAPETAKEGKDETPEPRYLVAESWAGRWLAAVMDGNFPEYDEVMATARKRAKHTATFHPPWLLAGVKAAMSVSTEENVMVQLTFSKGGVRLEVDSANVGKAHVDVSATWDGQQRSVGFRGDLLAELLKAAGDHLLKMKFGGAHDVAVFERGPAVMYLLAPCTKEEAEGQPEPPKARQAEGGSAADGAPKAEKEAGPNPGGGTEKKRSPKRRPRKQTNPKAKKQLVKKES